MTEEEFTKYLNQRLPDWSPKRMWTAFHELEVYGALRVMKWDGKGKKPVILRPVKGDALVMLDALKELMA